MINKLVSKETCCGCGVCMCACPVDAIKMITDDEGFEYPIVDEKKCINCGRCEKVCPFNDMSEIKNSLLETFAVKHRDSEVRSRSRSGGIFTALTDVIFALNGVVYGAVLDDDFLVKHIRAENKNDRDRMCGSKYVQSSTYEIWNKVKKDLDLGRTVLFSGTSCQIDALKKFLGKDPENLYCVDIVCHGVPSPKVFQGYIKWQEKKADSKCIKIDFRNKKDFGWADHIETLWMDNGKRVDSKVYARIFYSDYPLRPSCYACPYKSVNHPGDISIADYWNIEKACPGYNDNKGVSLVLINSIKGRQFLEAVSKSIECKKTKIENSMQKPFYESSTCPNNRDRFWDLFNQSDFEFIAERYGGFDKKEALNEKMYLIKARIKKMLKNLKHK